MLRVSLRTTRGSREEHPGCSLGVLPVLQRCARSGREEHSERSSGAILRIALIPSRMRFEDLDVLVESMLEKCLKVG